MPINTSIRPLATGGSGLLGAVSAGAQGFTSGYLNRRKEERARNDKREQLLLKVADNINPLDAISLKHQDDYNELIKHFSEETTKMVQENGGVIDYNTTLRAQNLKNTINSFVNKTKAEEKQIAQEHKEFFDKPGVYDPDVFKNNNKLYTETGDKKPFLELAAQDPALIAQNTVINKTYQPTGKISRVGDYDYGTQSAVDDKTRQGAFATAFNNRVDYRKGTVASFNGERGMTKNATEEERVKYINMANSLDKSITGDSAMDAAYLWGADNISPYYQPDKQVKLGKTTTKKDEGKPAIRETMNLFGQEYTNVVDFSPVKNKSLGNYVPQSNTSEIKEGTNRDFKPIDTTYDVELVVYSPNEDEAILKRKTPRVGEVTVKRGDYETKEMQKRDVYLKVRDVSSDSAISGLIKKTGYKFQPQAQKTSLIGNDKEAYDWAISNQNDKRAKQILDKLKKEGKL